MNQCCKTKYPLPTYTLFMISAGVYVLFLWLIYVSWFLYTRIGIPILVSYLITAFVGSFLKLLYEKKIIYQLPLSSFEWSNTFIYALIDGVMLTSIYFLIEKQFGHSISIPLSCYLERGIIHHVRLSLLPKNIAKTTVYQRIAEKREIYQGILFQYIGVFCLLIYVCLKTFQLSFLTAFFVAITPSLFIAINKEWQKIYDQKINFFIITIIALASILGGIIATVCTYILLTYFSMEHFTAVTISITFVKLIQFLLAPRLIYHFF